MVTSLHGPGTPTIYERNIPSSRKIEFYQIQLLRPGLRAGRPRCTQSCPQRPHQCLDPIGSFLPAPPPPQRRAEQSLTARFNRERLRSRSTSCLGRRTVGRRPNGPSSVPLTSVYHGRSDSERVHGRTYALRSDPVALLDEPAPRPSFQCRRCNPY